MSDNCWFCRGSGTIETSVTPDCSQCGGDGYVQPYTQPPMVTDGNSYSPNGKVQCGSCSGNGKSYYSTVVSSDCHTCRGSGKNVFSTVGQTSQSSKDPQHLPAQVTATLSEPYHDEPYHESTSSKYLKGVLGIVWVGVTAYMLFNPKISLWTAIWQPWLAAYILSLLFGGFKNR